MQRILLKSKIHRVTVTEAELDYEGSLTLDRNLMDAAAITKGALRLIEISWTRRICFPMKRFTFSI